jgi:hypothetical protein
MSSRLVHVDQRTFQRLPTSPWLNILNQTGHNNISEGRCVVRCAFGHIKKTVDWVNRPKDQNQALCSVNFLFDALIKFTTRRRPDRIMGRIKEGPWLIPGDSSLKEVRFLFHQSSQKEKRFEYDALLVDRESIRHPAKVEFCKPSLSRRIRKHVAFPIRKWRQSTSHELNGLSSSIEPIASARLIVKGLRDLGSSDRCLFPW